MINNDKLIRAVSEVSGISLIKTSKVIKAMVKEITMALKKNESVKIKDLGTFNTFFHKERRSANPRKPTQIITNQDVTLAKFKRSEVLKRAVRNAHKNK